MSTEDLFRFTSTHGVFRRNPSVVFTKTNVAGNEKGAESLLQPLFNKVYKV